MEKLTWVLGLVVIPCVAILGMILGHKIGYSQGYTDAPTQLAEQAFSLGFRAGECQTSCNRFANHSWQITDQYQCECVATYPTHIH